MPHAKRCHSNLSSLLLDSVGGWPTIAEVAGERILAASSSLLSQALNGRIGFQRQVRARHPVSVKRPVEGPQSRPYRDLGWPSHTQDARTSGSSPWLGEHGRTVASATNVGNRTTLLLCCSGAIGLPKRRNLSLVTMERQCWINSNNSHSKERHATAHRGAVRESAQSPGRLHPADFGSSQDRALHAAA
jgi:hypothetical protein